VGHGVVSASPSVAGTAGARARSTRLAAKLPGDRERIRQFATINLLDALRTRLRALTGGSAVGGGLANLVRCADDRDRFPPPRCCWAGVLLWAAVVKLRHPSVAAASFEQLGLRAPGVAGSGRFPPSR